MYKCVCTGWSTYTRITIILRKKICKKIYFLFFLRLMVRSRRRRISKYVLPSEVFQGIYTGALTYTYARTQTHIYTRLGPLCQIYDNTFLLCTIHTRIWFLSKNLDKYFRLSNASRCVKNIQKLYSERERKRKQYSR